MTVEVGTFGYKVHFGKHINRMSPIRMQPSLWWDPSAKKLVGRRLLTDDRNFVRDISQPGAPIVRVSAAETLAAEILKQFGH